MDYLTKWLQDRDSAGNLRQLYPVERLPNGHLLPAGLQPDGELLDFSSNDYLAFSRRPELLSASRLYLDRLGSGAGAARLMSGDLELFHQLEADVAGLKNQESALLFGSGYMANVGAIPALVGRGDVIFADRLDHASIYDGSRLAGAKLVRFSHNDLNDLEEKLKAQRGNGKGLIVVESIYSMDGDRCHLSHLVELKKRYSCMLMVDEAHATGVFGPNGGGVIQEDGVGREVDLAMGTFSKALGSYGAYIACSSLLREYLINRARSFIFSTGLPPAVAGASLAAVRLLETEPLLRKELLDNASYFKRCLQDEGLEGTPGPSQIVPVIIGSSQVVLKVAMECRRRGVYAAAVRPPTVPEGSARIRFSVTLHLTRPELAKTAGLIMEICRDLDVRASF